MDAEYKIKTIIQKQGPISISEFMDQVISNEQYGYYSNQNSISDDFITSPEISQLFGEMIGIWCFTIWQRLNYPSQLALIELGPGRGTLMNDLLRSTKHITGFHNTLNLNFIEISHKLESIQSENLSQYDIPKFWYKHIDEISLNIPHIIIGNEFFDALPIDQYKFSKGSWYKRLIKLDDQYNFQFINIMASHKEAANLSLEFQNIEDGSIVEISERSIKYMIDISRILKSNFGAALIIDYGYIIDKYIKRKTYSTLQAVKNHKYHSIFSEIGKSDLSAHVNFHKLVEIVKSYNLQYTTCNQRDFLINLGINIRANLLANNSSYSQKENIYKNLDRLIAQDKMGELFKTLAVYNISDFTL